METGIGKRIKQKRLELNLTQTDLANRLGLSTKSTICKIETGDDNLTLDRVTRYAKALDCTPGYLMGWEDEEQSASVSKMNMLTDVLSDPQMTNAIKMMMALDNEKKEALYKYINFLFSSN